MIMLTYCTGYPVIRAAPSAAENTALSIYWRSKGHGYALSYKHNMASRIGGHHDSVLLWKNLTACWPCAGATGQINHVKLTTDGTRSLSGLANHSSWRQTVASFQFYQYNFGWKSIIYIVHRIWSSIIKPCYQLQVSAIFLVSMLSCVCDNVTSADKCKQGTPTSNIDLNQNLYMDTFHKFVSFDIIIPALRTFRMIFEYMF